MYHDNVRKADSYMGFTASVHPKFTKFYNTTRLQTARGHDIVTNSTQCFVEAINAFYLETKGRFLPEFIVVFRDGVGESMIKTVQDHEVGALEDAIRQFEGYNPSFVYFIVNKDTNAKFYQENGGNPLPGTVVYKDVVPDSGDFYLIAHPVTQGIARPTLYKAISTYYENPNNTVPVQVLANLAYKLCNIYPNWTGGIKIPVCTFMAHKLAYLVGTSIHREEYNNNLKLLPFFL